MPETPSWLEGVIAGHLGGYTRGASNLKVLKPTSATAQAIAITSLVNHDLPSSFDCTGVQNQYSIAP
jgi:hypothetical protein